MSINSEPNPNVYITRVVEILQKSDVLFAKTNDIENGVDLVNKIFKYDFPTPENPPDVVGPPYVFVNVPENFILRRTTVGRSSQNTLGAQKLELQMYIIPVVHGIDYENSKSEMYDITTAIADILMQNITLSLDGADPLCYSLEYTVIPYFLNTDDNELLSQNIRLVIHLFGNNRE